MLNLRSRLIFISLSWTCRFLFSPRPRICQRNRGLICPVGVALQFMKTLNLRSLLKAIEPFGFGYAVCVEKHLRLGFKSNNS